MSKWFTKVGFLVLTLSVTITNSGLAGEIILDTETSWDGQRFNYPKGEARIVSERLLLKEGKVSPFHCHPMPTMGYIKSGLIEVETQPGLKQQFKAGDSVAEVMSTIHRGKAIKGDVEIIVFYAAVRGLPTTVLADGGQGQKDHCQ